MSFSFLNEIILAVILGVTQGVTEFLPISSTAHLIIVSKLLTNGRDFGLIASNVIQFGTILAVIQYFWKDLSKYFARVLEILFKKNRWPEFWANVKLWWTYPTPEEILETPELEAELAKLDNNKNFQTDVEIAQIALGTVPVVILGAILYSFAESPSNRTLFGIASFLLAGSVLMFLAERLHTSAQKFTKSKVISRGESLLVGMFQALAIFPGMSRSGSTISGALFLGRPRPVSVRFSFLLSIPAIVLAGSLDFVKLLLNILKNGTTSVLPQSSAWTADKVDLSLLSVFIAFVVSYLVGLICLRWLIKFLGNHTFNIFIYYRVIVAVIIFVMVFLGRI
ncbi:MAG: undecaprenyl-diphosphate phosphatase [bacterium]